MNFTHLRAKTHRSLEEGLMDVEKLVQKAVENNHHSVALTDLGTISGVIELQLEGKDKGVKPIIGLDAWIETDLTDKDSRTPTRLLLIAQNNEGYKKLMHLITRSNSENLKSDFRKPEVIKKKRKASDDEPVKDSIGYIKQSWLKEMGTEGLIALTGDPIYGEIPRLATQEDKTKASSDIKRVLPIYQELFPNNLYLEVSKYGHAQEKIWIERLVQLSNSTKIPLVATNSVLFGDKEDFFPHEVHAAITGKHQVLDPDYKPISTRWQYYTSTEEMYELFSDIPQAVENADILARTCNVELDIGINHLPDFPLPEGYKSADEYFVDKAKEGLEERLVDIFPDPIERAKKAPEYRKRLDYEIKVILDMEFPGYFLVVSDFINWSKDNDIPVGPGRGSGVGSLVAYSLKITNLDPIKHNLLFERFLNPERVSMPDIDIDFCRDRREETIQYIFDKYGEEAVSQISTFNTLTAKSAIRAVGRALNYPLPWVDEMAKLVPKDQGISLTKSMEVEPKLKSYYENDKQARRLLDMALKIEGASLTTGVHAGGVIIAPGKIDDYSPKMNPPGKDFMVTQLNYTDAEKAGLIKFDLLGLKTLTSLRLAKQLIDKRSDRKNNPIDLDKIPLDSPEALELLREGNTYGVFQLESKGMSRLLRSLRPDSFEDMVALIALFRPGPLRSGMTESFVRRKHGEEEISYYHPAIEEILKPTYGIIVYQEQVMQIAQKLAGYSLGGADLLRRAMGKKKPEEMAKERVKFEQGAIKNGIDPKLATHLFDLMEKFAEYGFNRSHSAAYAMVAMQTAYIKAVYPVEFFTSYMNVEIKNHDVLGVSVEDAKNLGINFVNPDVNSSNAWFEKIDDKTIRYGLGALKGSSITTATDIVNCRNEYGNFESLPDFIEKMYTYYRSEGKSAQMKQVCEILIKSGAFDKLHPDRSQLMAALPVFKKYYDDLSKRQDKESSGEIFLPALWKKIGIKPIAKPIKPRSNLKPLEKPELPKEGEYTKWHDLEKYAHEAKVVGFYLTGHPYESYTDSFSGLKATYPINEIENYNGNPFEPVLVAGIIESIRESPSKNGKMAFMVISDGQNKRDIAVFNEAYEQHAEKLKVGRFVGLEACIRDSKKNPGSKDVSARNILNLEEVESLLLKNINIVCSKDELSKIKQISDNYTLDKDATCTIFIPDGEDRYFKSTLPDIKISRNVDSLRELKDAFGKRLKMDFTDKISFEDNNPKNGFNKLKKYGK